MSARFSILIPTLGRQELLRSLQSCIEQGLLPGDEVIVVGDERDGPLDRVKALCQQLGPQFRYVGYDFGHMCWGHCGLTAAMQEARGDYLVFNDDDDVFTSYALRSIRFAVERQQEPVPHMFRFLTHYGIRAWVHPKVEQGNVGGHCIVVPNTPNRLGQWTCRYEGDYDFIRSTVDLWGEDRIVWRPEVIAVARPAA